MRQSLYHPRLNSAPDFFSTSISTADLGSSLALLPLSFSPLPLLVIMQATSALVLVVALCVGGAIADQLDHPLALLNQGRVLASLSSSEETDDDNSYL